MTITGEWTADRDILQLSEDDLRKGEFFFGLPAALVILLLVFGAVVASLVPLMLAIVSIVVALALTALVGQAFDLSVFVVNMLSGMGLALGIDYSLFILSRSARERARGRDKMDAIAAAGATSSRAVLFSGIAFALALMGMVIVPDTILRSLGTGAILVGIVAVAAALTLLPAVLSLLGDRVDSLRIPSKQGFLALEEGFGVGTANNVQVVVDGDVSSAPVRAAIDRLEQRLPPIQPSARLAYSFIRRSGSPRSRRSSSATARRRARSTR